MLRPYQQEAYDAVISHIKGDLSPCLVDAATGSGKSHIIAAIANWIHSYSKKFVLVLQPSKELVIQNREKYLATGNPASVYSASAGKKCLKHPVIFATPLSFRKAVEKIGTKIAAVIIDEAHGLTPTIKDMLKRLTILNRRLRVIGLTATPYRLGQGYIYKIDEDGEPVQEARDPYFHKLVYKVPAHLLIRKGYLTKPVIGKQSGYATKHLELNRRGTFNSDDLDKATTGQGRLTSRIIAEIVENARDRKGVLIFASTVKHAYECFESLPPHLSAIVTGKTNAKERADILEKFKAQKIKYIVNVSVLTTGFDAPHCDLIALLRPTESVSLLQQMIGRGLRICDGKESCMVLDYAENIERHVPDGDVFNPKIEAKYALGEKKNIKAECPLCAHENVFSMNKDCTEYKYDKHGYALDLNDLHIQTDYGPLPVHHGRRCNGFSDKMGLERCGYRWTSKECPECGSANDIAARHCSTCKHEIVDPNEKLREEFVQRKEDPYEVSTDRVQAWDCKDTLSKSGNEMYVVNFKTAYNTVTAYYVKGQNRTNKFLYVTKDLKRMPETITYYKDRDSKFWRIIAFDRREDETPT